MLLSIGIDNDDSGDGGIAQADWQRLCDRADSELYNSHGGSLPNDPSCVTPAPGSDAITVTTG